VTVLIRQYIFGYDLSYLTINLKTAGNVAIPLGIDLISVIHGVLYYLVLNVYTKL
jgi:hypothetical protein